MNYGCGSVANRETTVGLHMAIAGVRKNRDGMPSVYAAGQGVTA
jgi:hypothetical protein